MYRVKFDAKIGAWLVQLNRFYFLWESIEDKGEVMTWVNFEAAMKHVKSIGLDRVYRNYADSYSQQIQQITAVRNVPPMWRVHGEQ